jgi:DNA-binding NarL/FixJ family response regulator
MTAASILVIEDDALVSLDIQQQLVEMGYSIAGVATTGEVAVALAAERLPSLVLMDVRLTELIDGGDAARWISHVLHIPVVFFSALSDPDALRRAAQSAPYGFLSKPIRRSELHAAIEIALKASASREAEDHRWAC